VYRRPRLAAGSCGQRLVMGSIPLIAVPHDESDLATLRANVERRRKELVRTRMRADPALAGKVAQLLAE
jgi:hypothetical protein